LGRKRLQHVAAVVEKHGRFVCQGHMRHDVVARLSAVSADQFVGGGGGVNAAGR
jgi:hypothetical protein